MIAFPHTPRERVEEYLTNPEKIRESIGYAYSLTRNSDNAKEVVQDAVVKALQNADNYDLNREVKTWFYTIIRNTFLDEIKKRKFREECQILRNRGALKQLPADGNPIEILIVQERAEAVRKALEKESLTEKYKARLFARFFCNMSYIEMARIFGSNERTEKSRTDYAIEILRQDKSLMALVA